MSSELDGAQIVLTETRTDQASVSTTCSFPHDPFPKGPLTSKFLFWSWESTASAPSKLQY